MKTPNAAFAFTSPSPMINPQSAHVLHQMRASKRDWATDYMGAVISPPSLVLSPGDGTINISDFFVFSAFSSDILKLLSCRDEKLKWQIGARRNGFWKPQRIGFPPKKRPPPTLRNGGKGTSVWIDNLSSLKSRLRIYVRPHLYNNF